MNVKERILSHLAEAANTIFDELKSMGAKDITKPNIDHKERKFDTNLPLADVEKLLTKRGYKKIVDKPDQKTYRAEGKGKVLILIKAGKVTWMSFDFRVSSD
jgi:hypothetical protein